MVCIYCHGSLSVINSRAQKQRNQTWRRRKCTTCGAVFTSVETIDLARALSVETSGKLQAFSRDALFISLYESCRHRPTASTDATGLTDTVIAALLNATSDGLVSVEQIIRTTIEVLQRFDTAAAVQYEAYHPLPSGRSS